MARHNNPYLSITANRLFKAMTGDEVNSELAPITPTVELTRVITLSKTGFASNATSGNVYAVPADQDFYMTALTLSVIKDATATSTESAVWASVDGQFVRIATIATLTLTAQNASIALSFPLPLKVDRNSTITVQNGTAIANVRAAATIHGYIEP